MTRQVMFGGLFIARTIERFPAALDRLQASLAQGKKPNSGRASVLHRIAVVPPRAIPNLDSCVPPRATQHKTRTATLPPLVLATFNTTNPACFTYRPTPDVSSPLTTRRIPTTSASADCHRPGTRHDPESHQEWRIGGAY